MQNWVKALAQKTYGRDEYYSNVVSLLHFDGTDGSTTFDDEKGNVWTPTGAVELDASVKQFGLSSGLFSGGSIASPHFSGLDFGSGDFTIEFFVRRGSDNTIIKNIIDKRAVSGDYAPFLIRLDSTHRIQLFMSTSGTAWEISSKTSTTATTLEEFNHVAIVRGAAGIDIFLEGIKQGSTSALTGALVASSTSILIGTGPNGVNQLNGHLDDLRITKGIARYTSDFTPPTKTFPDR